jgi:hydrogenase maturation factor
MRRRDAVRRPGGQSRDGGKPDPRVEPELGGEPVHPAQPRRPATSRGKAEAAAIIETREPFERRVLGFLPMSALRLRAEFAAYEAQRRFNLAEKPAKDKSLLRARAILRGDTPIESCKVSPEGACAGPP